MTIIGVASDNVITVDVHSLCRLRGQVDRRATLGLSHRECRADGSRPVCPALGYALFVRAWVGKCRSEAPR